MSVEVLLEREASPTEVAAVEQTFRDAGIEATVSADMLRRGLGLYPWVVWIFAPTAALFFGGFLGEAGADAYKSLKALVLKLYEARSKSEAPKGVVELRDETVHEDVVLPENLPDKAWELLIKLEIPRTKSGQLRWDFKAEAWRDTFEIKD